MAFVQIGKLLRELIESYPRDIRVAAIGTGHLSLESADPASSDRTARTRSSTGERSTGSPAATSTRP